MYSFTWHEDLDEATDLAYKNFDEIATSLTTKKKGRRRREAAAATGGGGGGSDADVVDRSIVPSVVFDIDDTILYANSFDFGEKLLKAKRIDSVYKLYRKVLASRYGEDSSVEPKVFFITARPDIPGNMEDTRAQIEHLGFTKYRALMLRPEKDRDVGGFKKRARELAETRFGTHVVLTVGDQFTDIAPEPPKAWKVYADEAKTPSAKDVLAIRVECPHCKSVRGGSGKKTPVKVPCVSCLRQNYAGVFIVEHEKHCADVGLKLPEPPETY